MGRESLRMKCWKSIVFDQSFHFSLGRRKGANRVLFLHSIGGGMKGGSSVSDFMEEQP